jgi:hypothetical protein
VHWAAQLVLSHPAVFDSLFAAVQLGLGIGLLWKRSVRWTLVASIGWGLSVWYLGEGLGGLTAGTTLLKGAPGAALLYSVIACFAFPREGDSSIAPSAFALPVWAATWIGAAGLQLAAGNNTGASFTGMFMDAKSDNGGWIGRIDGHLANVHFGNQIVAALIATEVLVALWAFVPGRTQQLSFVVGSAIVLGSWFLVQGLGDLTTGQATDPNAGPLLILMGLAAYGARDAWAHLFAPASATNAISAVHVTA